MKGFLLLVTWFTPGQPTSHYQETFSSLEACEGARLQVIKDAERVRQGMVRAAPSDFSIAALSAPSVSAVCAAQ
jgi:hypothetical protein